MVTFTEKTEYDKIEIIGEDLKRSKKKKSCVEGWRCNIKHI